MNKNKYLICLLTVILWIIWRPLTIWVLHFDVGQRVPLFLLVLSCAIYWNELVSIGKSKPMFCLVWTGVWSYINGIIKHSRLLDNPNGTSELFFHTVIPIFVCLLCTILFTTSFNKTLRWVSRALNFYAFLAIIYSSNIGGDERMELMSININEIALYCTVGAALMLLRYVNKTLGKYEIITSIFPIFVCIMAGSRMGLLSLFIVILGLIVSKYNVMKSKNIIPLLLGLALLYFSFDYILHNTFAGERVLGTQDEMNDRYADFQTGTLWDLLGDRGFMYYYSWPQFLENPITGIGLYNYISHSLFAMRLHTEYAVQYVENGLVGFIPFVLFLFQMVIFSIRLRKSPNSQVDSKTATMCLFLLISILFSNLVLWSFDMICVFIVYALIYSNYYKYKVTINR